MSLHRITALDNERGVTLDGECSDKCTIDDPSTPCFYSYIFISHVNLIMNSYSNSEFMKNSVEITLQEITLYFQNS